MDDRVMGKLFGFAPCCVDYYCANRGADAIKRAKGFGGMRLCPACAKLPEEEVIMGIHRRRICPTLFPTMPGHEHFEVIVNDPRWEAAERDWLVANKQRYIRDDDSAIERVHALHRALARLETEYAEAVEREPERKPFLHAAHELAKEKLVSEFMNDIFIYMRGRVMEQIKSGHIPIPR